jgi:hypothetical protein
MLLDLFPETKRRAARSFTGWSLNAAISCDEAHPGFLRFLYNSQSITPSVIFGALALVLTTEQKPSLLGYVRSSAMIARPSQTLSQSSPPC